MLALAAAAAAAPCGAWSAEGDPVEVRGLPFADASGLATSATRPGVWFLHGDRGDEPVLAAVDAAGRVRSEHRIADAENKDWEDLAAAPCPDEGDCLYVADTGDNDLTRPSVTVYVVREPAADDDRVSALRRYTATFPDGPRDVEALLVDPCTGRVHLVTKDAVEATVYRLPFDPEAPVVLEEVARFALDAPTAEAREVTAGDWHPDGDVVAIRGSDRVWLWAVGDDRETFWDAAPEVLVGTSQVQGEGLAFDGDDLVTCGEGAPTPLARRACEAPGEPAEVCRFPQTGPDGCGCRSGGSRGAAGLAPLLLLLTRRRALR